MNAKRSSVIVLTAALLAAGHALAAVDEGAAEALMKKSGCFKCHSMTAKKSGPSYKSVADKYRGKPDAEATLFKHLTTHPTVKVDGEDEKHDSLKTTNDDDVRNVVRFILSH